MLARGPLLSVGAESGERRTGTLFYALRSPLCAYLGGPWMSMFAIRRCGARLAGFLVLPNCGLQIVDCRWPHLNLQSAIYNLQSIKERNVSNYTVEELIARWKREELTVEQMIGQILLVLKEQEQRLHELGRASAGGNPPAAGQERRRR